MNNNSLKNSENDKMARLLIQFEKLELEHG